MDTDHKITMDLEWKTPLETYGELKGYRVRYGRINANQLTDILITDPNVHHQVAMLASHWLTPSNSCSHWLRRSLAWRRG